MFSVCRFSRHSVVLTFLALLLNALTPIVFAQSITSVVYQDGIVSEVYGATQAAYDALDEEEIIVAIDESESVAKEATQPFASPMSPVVPPSAPGVPQTIAPSGDDAAYSGGENVSSAVYEAYHPEQSTLNPVLPALPTAKNQFLAEETNSTGYHYIVSAPAGAYKAEGMLQLPKSFKLTEHAVFKSQSNNDVPYFFFGIYTAKGGLDVGICWQKTPQYPQGVWQTFCTVFPKSGKYYTHTEGKPLPGLEPEQILQMTAIQYDDGVRLELRSETAEGALELLTSVDFDIPGLALKADGRGTFFNREISLAQHRIDYTNGAEMIGARWWDAKLTWTNYTSVWDSGVVSLARTRWEPVSEMRVTQFEQQLYSGEEVSFIYSARPGAAIAGK